jgi:16S rRNA (uracil1498-N3)-methyltransferase
VIIVLVPPGVVAGRRERLDDAELHHLRVRRAADGEPVELRDGEGLVGRGRLAAAGRGFEVEVETAGRRDRPAALTLAVGAGDRERFGWLVEKATELGATSVVPLETEHSRAVATRVREPHLDKLRRLALEAVKQCGAAWAVEVRPLSGLSDFLGHERGGHCWIADPAGAIPPAAMAEGPATVLVGPEGGFSLAEREVATAAGYLPIALGPNVLRFETAALAAAAAVTTARQRGAHG